MLRSSKSRWNVEAASGVVNAGFMGLSSLIALNHAFRKDARVTTV
jgi:hypothetical protein